MSELRLPWRGSQPRPFTEKIPFGRTWRWSWLHLSSGASCSGRAPVPLAPPALVPAAAPENCFLWQVNFLLFAFKCDNNLMV